MRNPRSASRVLRTIHQGILVVVVAWLPFMALLDLPASTMAWISTVTVGLLAAVAKTYNVLFPAEEPLSDEV